MAEFPSLPLWTDAYLADTRHLTTQQHGAYLLLLMEAWRRPNTNLPLDDVLLARLAGLSASEWHDMRDIILQFFTTDLRTKTISQKRLTDEKSYVAKSSKKQRSNAKSRWNKEKELSHGNANGDAKTVPEACQTDAPTPTPTPTPTTPPKGGVEQPGARSVFEQVEQRLFAVDGVKGSNLEMSPLTAMVMLVQEGFDLDGEIIPLVKADLAKADQRTRRRMAWSTIADRVREQRERAVNGAQRNKAAPLPPPAEVSQEDWESRMRFGRRNSAWPAKWGPYPNQPGCLVPASLVKPDDGKGWTEWKAAS